MPADENLPVAAPEKKWRLGFWSLIATQFQGAFNENALKFLVIYLILAVEKDKAQRDQLELLVGVLFAAPFILFSLTGGYLADRFSKRGVTIWTKVFEVGVMLFATAALVGPNLKLALAAIFLVCTQGALFGPSKYGLLPELLPQERLSWGNGVLERGPLRAINVGSVSGSFLAEVFQGREIYSGALLLGFTIVGLAWSFGISRVPAADPAKRFRLTSLIDVWSPMKVIRSDRVLWLAVLGNTYFFFVAGLLQFNIFIYGQDVLHIRSTEGGFLQAAIAIGIGLGSFFAGYLSGGKIEYGLIPLGSLGMIALGLCLAIPDLSFRAVLLLLAALGFFGGFFIVPISALIQHQPEEDKKGVVIGAANWLSFVGIGAASAVYYAATHFAHLSPGGIFFWSALATLGATAYVLWLLPDSLLRLILWIATHTLYRLDVAGRENVPPRGGALLTPNHVSMADAVLLIASLDRPIRFLMFKGSYEHPLVKPFAKMLRVIPIASDQGPREMIHSLRQATQALQNGELVCIFPEGQMTRIGQMLPFRRGMERVIKGVDVPILPVHLHGVWGSIFSLAGGRFLWKLPRHLPYPVRVTFGEPLLATATSIEARRAVQDLGAEAFARRKKHMRTLPGSFVHTARRHPFRFAMADGQTPLLNFFAVLARSTSRAWTILPRLFSQAGRRASPRA